MMMTSDGHMTCGRSHWRKRGRIPYRTHSSNPKEPGRVVGNVVPLTRETLPSSSTSRRVPSYTWTNRTHTPPVLNTSDDWQDLFSSSSSSSVQCTGDSHLEEKKTDSLRRIFLSWNSERFKIIAINQRWWWLVCYTDGQEDQAHQMEAALAR